MARQWLAHTQHTSGEQLLLGLLLHTDLPSVLSPTTLSENVVGARTAANGLLKANVFAGLIIRKMRSSRSRRLKAFGIHNYILHAV